MDMQHWLGKGGMLAELQLAVIVLRFTVQGDFSALLFSQEF